MWRLSAVHSLEAKRANLGWKLLSIAVCLWFTPLESMAEARRVYPTSQPVTFKTEDEYILHGTYVPPSKPRKTRTGKRTRDENPSDKISLDETVEPDDKGRLPMVILLHGELQDRRIYDPLIPWLHEAGMAVLAIDLRGHGMSGNAEVDPELPERAEGKDARLFEVMDRDVAAAYLWMREQQRVDPTRFALIGADAGCYAVWDYAAHDRSVDVVICLNPEPEPLSLDSIQYAAKCKGRDVLLVAGEPNRDSLEPLVKKVPDVDMYWLKCAEEQSVPRAVDMLGRTEKIERIVTEFLVDQLCKPSPHPIVASINSKVYHEPDSSTVKRIKDENLRHFSSEEEAGERGMRSSRRKD